MSYPYRDLYQHHTLNIPDELENTPHRSFISLAFLLQSNPTIEALNLNSYYCQLPPLQRLPSRISNLSKLKLLNIEQNELDALGTLFEISTLEVLGLKGNRLQSLPPNIAQLSNLSDLSLGENPLQSLPDQITALHKLKKLLLVGNPITSLPKDMSGLQSLEEFELSSGSFLPLPLQKIPPSMFLLPKLRFCTIHHAKLKQLPSTLSEAIALEELSITQTDLNSIPSLLKLKKLKTLILSENQLQTFSCNGLDNITELDLCENGLTSISSMNAMHAIQKIDLSCNQLQTLPTLDALAELKELNIAYNPITALPNLKNLPQLQEIHISANISQSLVRSVVSKRVRLRNAHY